MKLFLGGDLMLGRGVDQILPCPVDPELHEDWIRDARDYVALAERRSGPIPRGVDPAWPWGDALAALDRERPDARIANLETSITARGAPDPAKGVHYRLSPGNAAALEAGRIDVAALANNHVLDWGPDGLADTLSALRRAGIAPAGAGRDLDEALAPAVVERRGRRVLAWSVATGSSGVPEEWAAGAGRPGVARLTDLSRTTADALVERIARDRRSGDLAVVSIHWGDNWGYDVGADEIAFAHRLVDGGVDAIHGHSAHHPRPVEVYRERPIFYGTGELVDDYEGISGYERFRPELVALWFPSFGPDGALRSLGAVPMRLRRLRLEAADERDAAWLAETLGRICRPFGRRVRESGGRIAID